MAKAPIKRKQKCSSDDHNTKTTNNHVKIATTKVKRARKCSPRKSPFQRSSKYRGVTRHRWTGRYEAHLWDKDSWIDTQKKKGKQVYLGAYDDEATAARAYDLAALKYWGENTILNFSLSTYEDDMKEMDGLSREEYLGSLRRKSNGFSRGLSKYRGVARHHYNGRWEARIGRVLGNKYLYLGTFATQEEAASAYDIAAIQYRGLNAVTNFDLSHYLKPNNSSDNQPSPKDTHVEPNKSVDSSVSTSSSNQSFLGHTFEQTYDQVQVDDAISIDEIMGGQPPLLSFDEFDLLEYNMSDDNLYMHMEGQCSSTNDIRNHEKDFFSDLNSILCDFDVMEAEQIGTM
ncbi:hypothetical protein BVRB_8g191760 [Beta vulgaris subsp. vulgaris]|nr:hypothetical protein BVRB_8g191760 [Beta vulgaris subsp. vulgaris]